jgi:hypothetical protein
VKPVFLTLISISTENDVKRGAFTADVTAVTSAGAVAALVGAPGCTRSTAPSRGVRNVTADMLSPIAG